MLDKQITQPGVGFAVKEHVQVDCLNHLMQIIVYLIVEFNGTIQFRQTVSKFVLTSDKRNLDFLQIGNCKVADGGPSCIRTTHLGLHIIRVQGE